MKQRIFTLALTGALCVGLLAGCGGTAEETPSPTPPAAETATPVPTDTPVLPSPTPEETVEPEDTVEPEEPETSPSPALEPDEPEKTETPAPAPTPTAKPTPEAKPTPTATPAPAPEPTPAPTPTPAPEPEGSAVQAVWDELSGLELPALADVDDEILSALYGIDSADLTDYICKVSMMNVHATEFFIAQVAEGKMDTIKAAVESRQASLEETWSWYLPEQYELVQNYKLITNGNYILFAVSVYTDEAAAAFDSHTK